jgi:RNA polymerase sigma-70 factor, ECF subfamily
MLALELPPMKASAPAASSPASCEEDFRSLFAQHHGFIWRQLRRLGVPEASVDDAAQEVFIVAARRMNDIRAGAERSFLFGVARRVASDARRSQHARVSAATQPLDANRADEHDDPEQVLQGRRAQDMLHQVLDAMADDAREVFVLFELEEMSRREIAELLDLPEGTAASRLRRAREEFMAIAGRLKATAARGAP